MAEESFVEMMIDGKKTTVSDKVLKSRMMRGKKVEMEINGKIVRVSEHMLTEISRFGASKMKRSIKSPPNEVLLMMEPKQIILPVKEEIKEPELPAVELGLKVDRPEVKAKNKGGRPKVKK